MWKKESECTSYVLKNNFKSWSITLFTTADKIFQQDTGMFLNSMNKFQNNVLEFKPTCINALQKIKGKTY